MSTAFNQVVQRSVDGVSFPTLATLSPLVTSFTDTGLTSGNIYTYRVITVNPTDAAAPSNAASATPPAYQPSGPPTNLLAITSTSTTATLIWTPPVNDLDVVGYVVYRDGKAVATTAGKATTFIDSGLSPATAYFYFIASVDSIGAVSAAGPGARAITSVAPPVHNAIKGTVIGTPGSYGNSVNTIAKAADGDYNTYFDSPTADSS